MRWRNGLPQQWLHVDKLLQQAEALLREAGCDSPRREARLLWERAVASRQSPVISAGITEHVRGGEAVGVTGGFSLKNKNPTEQGEEASPECLERFDTLLQRRLAREPMSQILGYKAFWTLDFCVNEHTLTPRPDSETLVEAALNLVSDKTSPLRLLDLGTGSGCLLLSLLHEFPQATGIGVDKSEEALAVAAQNASNLGLSTRARFVCGNWAQGITETFDMVISNPPYIPQGDAASLMPEVRYYEPHSALFAGEDGLTDYRRILAEMPRLLRKSGHAVLELGIGQAEAVRQIGEAVALAFVNFRHDLAGIPRAIIFINP